MPDGRGGRRRGQQGKAYPERTDLTAQPVKTGPSKEYGQAVASQQAQQAIPLPQAPAPRPVSLHTPTARPDEHVMTGVPMGGGAGPEAIVPPPRDFSANGPLSARDRLQAMLQSAHASGQNADDLALLVSRLGW